MSCQLTNVVITSSPHTRRYFQSRASPFSFFELFSAHAEVFPPQSAQKRQQQALLRTRGGISIPLLERRPVLRSSPHARRYFRITPRR